MDFGNLKVLMISSDKKILSPGSGVSLRMKEYAKLVGELHIVLLTKTKDNLKETKLDNNLWVYPTHTSSRWLYPFSGASLGKKIVYEKKFVRGNSLITAQDPFESGWIGLKIKRKWRLPLEVQLHTDPFSSQFYGALNSIRKILANKVIKNADHIRVVNESLKTTIMDVYEVEEKKISVLPIYIDKEKILKGKIDFDLHSKFGWHFILLMITRLTPEKNIPFALEILKKVVERFPTTGMVIVGEGPLEESLKNYSYKIGIEKNVTFVGRQNELFSYLHTANAFLQTSKYEGYGMALIEAGLSGLPVITTPVGFANELENGKNAYIGPIDNTEYFKDAIIDLIENNSMRENLKLNMKNTLESKLISKEEYLKKIQDGWNDTAKKIS